MLYECFLPKQIVLITSREHVEIMGSTIEKEDIYPIITHTLIDNNILLNKRDNKESNTYLVIIDKSDFIHELISKSKVFCINLVSQSFSSDINLCKENNIILRAGIKSEQEMQDFERSPFI